MKKIKIFSLVILIATLISCSGSDSYRGIWKATDPSGNKFEITFEAKSFVIKELLGKSNKYDYTQNSVKTENFVALMELNYPIAEDMKLIFLIQKMKVLDLFLMKMEMDYTQ